MSTFKRYRTYNIYVAVAADIPDKTKAMIRKDINVVLDWNLLGDGVHVQIARDYLDIFQIEAAT